AEPPRGCDTSLSRPSPRQRHHSLLHYKLGLRLHAAILTNGSGFAAAPSSATAFFSIVPTSTARVNASGSKHRGRRERLRHQQNTTATPTSVSAWASTARTSPPFVHRPGTSRARGR